MIYAEYDIIDLGYALVSGDVAPLGEIWGLSNRVINDPETGEVYDERFVHQGYEGYPAGAAWLTEQRNGADQPVRVLAAFDSEPDAGGTPVPAEGVPALLMADYGWPDGTTLGEDGLPVAAG